MMMRKIRMRRMVIMIPKKLFTPMLQLLSHTGKTKTSLLHHLASERGSR